MRTNKPLLPIVALLAAAGAFWFFLLAPKREEAAALSEQVSQKRDEVQQAAAQLAIHRRAQQSFKVNYATLARLGKAVPADDDMRSLMVQIDAAAGASKVDFRSIDVASGGSTEEPTTASDGPAPPPGTEPVGDAGFAVMPLSLMFEGEYAELSDFFSRLEAFVRLENERVDVTGRLLRIENFTITPDSENSGALSASVGASSYLVPAAEGLLGGATAAGPVEGAPPAPDDAASPVTTTATATGALR